MNLCTIASGSSGNCTYINTDDVSILIDVGISGQRVIDALTQINAKPENIDAIFITHEHIDHIKGAGIFSRKYNVSIYATQKTWDVILQNNLVGTLDSNNIKIIEPLTTISLNHLNITAFPISHDAIEPVGYVFEANQKKLGLVTDIGIVDDIARNILKECNGIMLESNHDPNMLEVGRYSYYLKRRIASKIGHLSNEDASDFLANLYHKDLKWAMFAHLSSDNNVPSLAYITAKNALSAHGITIGKDIDIYIADKKSVSPVLSV
ncbi:MAG: MBL fold metallo-hydrolase [Epulopiscium sp. Nuni2H_MBin003]|nr:MAG: MBL fold metallo-hydrolase [Epulopiscium sp. Nuni2H_MBin003]